MTQYLLSVVTPTEGGEPPTPDELSAIMARVEAVQTRVRQAGAWVFAGGLAAPSSATVLRPKGDEVLAVDGPFAEGQEDVGGLSIGDVDDLDGELRRGREFVAAIGLPIEVRPLEWRPSRRSSRCSASSTRAPSPSSSGCSGTSTSPRRRSPTRSPRRCSAGRRTASRPARPAGSSPP